MEINNKTEVRKKKFETVAIFLLQQRKHELKWWVVG